MNTSDLTISALRQKLMNWLASGSLSAATPTRKHGTRSPHRRRRSWHVQTLEDRALLATFEVISTGNTGTGTLRWAIEQANATFGQDLISFNIPGTGVQSIKPTTALPTITETVIIDGTTQPGWSSTPVIELNGSLAGTNQTGLNIDTSVNETTEYFTYASFTTAKASLGGFNKVTFDNLAAGNGRVTGSEYSAQGLLISHRDGKPLNIVPQVLYALPQNFNSLPNGLSSGFGANGSSYPGFAENSDNINLTLTTPSQMVGLWLGNIGGSANQNTLVEFLNASGSVIVSETLNPTHTGIITSGGYNNRQFYGVRIAGMQRISTIRITNAASNDDAIIIDDVEFTTTNMPVTGPGGAIVRGLAVNAWTSTGIALSKGYHWVTQCHIGTDAAGLAAVPNVTGITVNGTANIVGTNLDGISDGSEGNVISGNSSVGIRLPSTGNMNRIAGNFIGPDQTGTKPVPGQPTGIEVDRYNTALQIGGPRGAATNLISGNSSFGVFFRTQYISTASTGTKIQGNYLGTDRTGTVALSNSIGIGGGSPGNGKVGTLIIGTDGDGIDDSTEGNLISGNGDGISIACDLLVVAGNKIGTTIFADKKLPNSRGIYISDGTARIGTNADSISDASEGNIISGNTTSGIHVYGFADADIAGNKIGTNHSGTTSIPNQIGIKGQGTTSISRMNIGGSIEIQRNIISGNTDYGIHAEMTGSVLGNFIGTNATGSGAIPNGIGALIYGGTVVIGDSGPARNLISGNLQTGLSVGGQNMWVKSNLIGTDITGENSVPNVTGVEFNANKSILGTNGDGVGDLTEGNIISANTGVGAYVSGSSTDPSWGGGLSYVSGNYIGVSPSGRPLGNGSHGIYSSGSTDRYPITIGVRLDAANPAVMGNTIGFNGGSGIYGYRSTGDIAGNYIGVLRDGTPAGNSGDGIYRTSDGVSTSSYTYFNTLGFGSLWPNTIRFNGGYGVYSVKRYRFRGQQNIISDNGLSEFYNSGITLNSAGSADNHPVLTSLTVTNGQLAFAGFARAGQTVNLYEAGAGSEGEGKRLIASFVEGSAADLDSTAGSYGPVVNGLTVGSDTANRFLFQMTAPDTVYEGLKFSLQGMAPTIANSDNSNVMSRFSPAWQYGTSLSSIVPTVQLGSAVTLAPGESLSRRAGFTDTDSLLWSARVNYGDGSGWKVLTLLDNFQFDLSKTYSSPGTFTVTVEITDSSGVTGTGTLAVTIQNDAPEAAFYDFTLTPVVTEGGTVTLTGKIVDSLSSGAYSVNINWGNGATSTVSVPATARTFSTTYTYRDDSSQGGTPTAADVYSVGVSVGEAGGASDATPVGAFLVEVRNAVPAITSTTWSATTVTEGGTVTLAVNFTDAGLDDSHSLRIDWGDGVVETITPAVGTRVISNRQHTYTNTPRTGEAGYTVRIELTDDDEPLSRAVSTQLITVTSPAPSALVLSNQTGTASIPEGGTFRLGGSFTPSGTADPHLVTIDWGDRSGTTTLLLAAGVASFSNVTHVYADDAPGTAAFTITVKVSDTDNRNLTTSATLAALVMNAAPVPAQPAFSLSTVSEGNTVTATGTWTDTGTPDQSTVSISWGNGVTTPAAVDSKARTWTATYTYPDNGPGASRQYTVTATVTDDDGGVASASRLLTVQNVAPAVTFLPAPGQNNALAVLLQSVVSDPGTADTFSYAWTATAAGQPTQTGSAATFTLNRSAAPTAVFLVLLTVTDDDGSSGQYSLDIQIGTSNSETIVLDNSSFSGSTNGVLVLGLGGDDVIDATGVTDPAISLVMDGGSGLDVLYGGSGNDIYILADGNDAANMQPWGSVSVSTITPNTAGSDTYLLTPNSTLSVFDDSGSNTLDFQRSAFGVTLDLSAVSTAAASLQDVAPAGTSPATHYVALQGAFAGLNGTGFSDTLTAGNNSMIRAGAGADRLAVKAGTVGASVFGGADDDLLTVTGTGIASLNFGGDSGNDLLVNQGTISGLTFSGGADQDLLQNLGTINSTLNFGGDSGADLLANAGTIAGLVFSGGADQDLLVNNGSVATTLHFGGDQELLLSDPGSITSLNFGGDSGNDIFVNLGSISSLIFTGGADDDLLVNMGGLPTLLNLGGDTDTLLEGNATIGSLNFGGDDGNDVLLNRGTLSSLVFTGGADDDLLRNLGSISDTLNFGGDSGTDMLLNTGSLGAVIFTGGADEDLLINNGSVATSLNVGGDQELLVGSGTIAGLNFGGDSGNDVLVNLSSIGSVIFTGGADDDLLINIGSASMTLNFGGDQDILLNGAGSLDTLNFGGDSGNDMLINGGLVSSVIFTGGADDDLLINTANNITSLNFGGDSGNDLLQNSGTGIASIVFGGDSGADLLTNSGSIASVTFSGGADADLLTNTGTITGTLNFGGDSGSDLLQNSGTLAGVIFTGGADEDLLVNTGTVTGTLNFGGDSGSDMLYNTTSLAGVIFTGGADADLLVNSGTVSGGLNFGGDSGNDTLLNSGTLSSVIFTGGADADLLLNTGTISTSLNFGGDSGNDLLINDGPVATVIFTGGADNDRMLNSRSGVASITFYGGAAPGATLPAGTADGEDLLLNTGASIASIVFSGDAGNDNFRNSGSLITAISMTGGAGIDGFANTGSSIDSLDFHGGAGSDLFLNAGDSVRAIVITGDGEDTAGDDLVLLRGSGTNATNSTVQFTGNGGNDVLHNYSTGFRAIAFTGGAGLDLFLNVSASALGLTFNGGDGDDVFQNQGGSVAGVSFDAGAGNDLLVNTGAGFTGATFIGGDGDDLLLNTATTLSGLSFAGDAGADQFINSGSSLSSVTFTGGDGADSVTNTGTSFTSFTFHGGAGNDRLTNRTGSLGTATLIFNGGADNDILINEADSATGITFNGDAGNDGLLNTGISVTSFSMNGAAGDDLLENRGALMSGLTFSGGDGNDALRNTGASLNNVTFQGQAGADLFISEATALNALVFSGGDGADSLLLRGIGLGTINASGDAGDDLFENYAAGITSLTVSGGDDDDDLRNHGNSTSVTFNGDAGHDSFTNTATTSGTLNFNGGTGSDSYLGRGGTITTLAITLGADSDSVRIADASITNLSVQANDGMDSVQLAGTGTTATIDLGAAADWVAAGGSWTSVVLAGGSGDDTLMLSAAGTLTVDAGEGNDRYLLVGNTLTSVVITEQPPAAPDTSVDTLDFSPFTRGALTLDLSLTTTQSIAGMNFRLTSGTAIENVIGTTGADAITGNSRNNRLEGGDYSQPFTHAVAPLRTTAQWVLLDFDSQTQADEHQYSTSTRQAIVERLNAIYRGPVDASPWFNVRFALTAAQIPVADYVRVYVNQTPDSGRPGGLASDIDPGNLRPGGTAIVQINGMLGGIVSEVDAIPVHDHGSADWHSDTESETILAAVDPVGLRKPTASVTNMVRLTSKVIAHELGHLLGLRHQDSFGPIGYGVNLVPGVSEFNPVYPGPAGAFETFQHMMGSPASVGTTRNDDLGDLFFGERELIKLTAAMSEPTAVHQAEISVPHRTPATAQLLTPVALQLPNSIGSGMNKGDALHGIYQSVTGSIMTATAGGVTSSESDYYRISARAGDIYTFEVMSVSIAAFGNLADNSIDPVIRLYNSAGQLVQHFGGVAENDDSFEPSDAALMDIVIPATGDYYLEVDTFKRSPTDPLGDPTNPNSPLNSNNPRNILAYPDLVKRFTDTINDTDVGSYQLVLYAFRDAAASDGTNTLLGNGGTDILIGTAAADTTAPVSQVQPLAATATGLNLTINAVGSDPDPGFGSVSGIAEYRIFVAVNSGAFALWTTLPAGSPTTVYTAQSNNKYWFRSIAVDNAGNIESKPPGADTWTIVGDFDKPETAATGASATDAGLITITAAGRDIGGSALQTIRFYVSIDGAAAQLIGSVSPTATTGGNYTASLQWQGLVDGITHTYGFYTVGVDSKLNTEDAPGAPDVTLTRRFDPPPALTATGIDVQLGALQRSYIRYLDLQFSAAAGVPALLTAGAVRLERFSIDAATAANIAVGTGTPVSLGTAAVNGSIVRFDFGTNGLGGSRTTTAGDGFYRISVDTNQDGVWDDSHFEFFRLFGDADGNAVVNAADTALVTSQLNQRGSNLNGDLDGDERVTTSDRLYAARNVGRKLRDWLLGWLDD